MKSVERLLMVAIIFWVISLGFFIIKCNAEEVTSREGLYVVGHPQNKFTEYWENGTTTTNGVRDE